MRSTVYFMTRSRFQKPDLLEIDKKRGCQFWQPLEQYLLYIS